jgi:hypothetical protein
MRVVKVYYHTDNPPEIVGELANCIPSLKISRQAINNIVNRFERTGSVRDTVRLERLKSAMYETRKGEFSAAILENQPSSQRS